jgi:hypothetical protein
MNTEVATKEGLVSFRGYNIWYRIGGGLALTSCGPAQFRRASHRPHHWSK